MVCSHETARRIVAGHAAFIAVRAAKGLDDPLLVLL